MSDEDTVREGAERGAKPRDVPPDTGQGSSGINYPDDLLELIELARQDLYALQHLVREVLETAVLKGRADLVESALREIEGSRAQHLRAFRDDPIREDVFIAETQFGLGLLCWHTGRPAVAIDHFRRSAEYNSDAKGELRATANMALSMRKAGFARGEIERAVGKVPASPDDDYMRYLRGLVYYALGSTEDAARTWEQVLKQDKSLDKLRFEVDIDTGDDSPLHRRVALALVSLHTEKGRKEEADRVWNRHFLPRAPRKASDERS